MIKESNVSLCVSDLSANYERQEEGLRQSLMSWAALTVPWSHWSTGNARGLKHELLPSITLTQLDILAITVVGNSKNYQIVPKMCVIVEQSKTDVRSISVFSRSCSLAAWPFMSKAWISTERATVWGRLWCHFAVHCVTKKKKSSAFEVFAVLSADDRKADAALDAASHAPTCRSVCVWARDCLTEVGQKNATVK